MHSDGITLAELAARIDARVEGDGAIVVRRVGSLEHAGSDAIAFLAQPRLRPLAARTKAAALIVAPADIHVTTRPRLVHDKPYAAYARCATILHPAVAPVPGIDATARVAATARVDPAATVGPFAVIGDGASVGAGAMLAAHVVVGDNATIGEGARIGPHVTVYAGCSIGPRTVVHAGAVIGADGFGMAEQGGRWLKIPQVGAVRIGADCEIGANTTIDRGAIDDTVIEDDVKLDNQIQIGHNCSIGAHTAIAGCTGVAGSTVIGRNVRIGGAAMIAGHLTIPDNSVIAGATTVLSPIRESGFYNSAFPLMKHTDWRYAAVEIRRLRALAARVAALESRLRAEGIPEDAS